MPLAVGQGHLPLRIVSGATRELVVDSIAVDETRVVVHFNRELSQSGLVHQGEEAHWRTSSLLVLDPDGRKDGELERKAIGPKYSVRRNADLGLALDLVSKSIRIVVILNKDIKTESFLDSSQVRNGEETVILTVLSLLDSLIIVKVMREPNDSHV